MVDLDIAGYRYGRYWLAVADKSICGIGSGRFSSEADLLSAYDKENLGSPLVRVMRNGSETILRTGRDSSISAPTPR